MQKSSDKIALGSTIKSALQLLDKSDRTKLILLTFVQIFLSLLDLLGVALIGILGSLAVSGVASRESGSRVYQVLKYVGLSDNSFQFQVAIVALISAILLISKTILSVYLTRKTTYYLSRRGARISGQLLSRLLNTPLAFINANSSQSNLYSVGAGVNTIVVGILSAGVALLSDSSLLIVMLIGLFVVDFTMAITSIVIFLSIGLILYFLMNRRAGELGKLQAEMSISYNQKIVELLGTYREAYVHNRRSFYSEKLTNDRLQQADLAAEFALMPNTSKYVLEATVILTAIVASGIQFSIHDATHAVAVLSVFLAASTRISPAVLRIQQGLVGIKNALGGAKPSFDLISNLKEVDSLSPSVESSLGNYDDFIPELKASSISLEYENMGRPALLDISFEIYPGESVAIVGSSGAGKTSLVDTLLGLHLPKKGEVLISNLVPKEAISRWPGAISYVPQDILIIDGTIRENVALGYPVHSISDQQIRSALSDAMLLEFVNELPNGINSYVGDKGVNLSGGQRQRLGIARALVTKPKILILDEATSALDAKTELEISNAIQNMHGKVTVITIAHRLSTVQKADKILYLEKGILIAQGTFEHVRTAVTDFDEQAKLMGL